MTINEAQNPQAVQPAGGAVAPQPQGAAVADMAKAQELLLRLLTLLTPMTSSSSTGAGQGGPLSFPIEGKKYDPPGQRPDVLTRQPVRLLPPLEQMRREVAQLLTTLEGKPEGEGAEGKNASAESPSKPAQLSASVRPTMTKQTFEARDLFSRPRPLDPKAASPMQKLAEKAIDEVRSVIRYLATSTMLSKPNRETLQVAMKQVQPTIEHLIKTVEKLPSKPQTQSPEPKPTWSRPSDARPLPTPAPPQELPELVIPKQIIPEGVDQALAEQQQLSEPKVHGPVPFQQQTSSDERRRRERKKGEKSLFWEEEKQLDPDEDEQET